MQLPRLRVTAFFLLLSAALIVALSAQNPSEAPTGFTTPTNCPATNLPAGIGSCASNGMAEPAGITFAAAQADFEEQEDVPEGLGPIYNDKSCANCHQNPVTGGISQITEFRAGHRDAGLAEVAVSRDGAMTFGSAVKP